MFDLEAVFRTEHITNQIHDLDVLLNESTATVPVPKLQERSVIFVSSKRLVATCHSHATSEQ